MVISESGKVTLVDFGLAVFSKSRDLMMAGTTFYIAPEMVLGKYDSQVDLWSLGVLSYLLLTTFLPFGGETREDVFVRICDSRLRFPEDSKLSKKARSFLKRLLRKDPDERMTTDQALQHPFIVDNLKGEFRQFTLGQERKKTESSNLSKRLSEETRSSYS